MHADQHLVTELQQALEELLEKMQSDLPTPHSQPNALPSMNKK
jgi:hypothetical protein